MTTPIDPDWDWIPVLTDGDVVAEGDTLTFTVGYRTTVTGITEAANGSGGTTYTFASAGGDVVVDWPAVPGGMYDRTYYVVTAQPDVGTTFTNTGDGSRWVFTASEAYRCFDPGATYQRDTVLDRAHIAGKLVEDP